METKKVGLDELCESYKAIAILSKLAVAENDISGVMTLNNSLKRISQSLSGQISSKTENILESYNKLLALNYAKLKTDNPDEQLKIIKMQLAFDYKESLHSISLAQLFYQEKKYKEAITLAEYLTMVCESAPPYLLLAQSYRDLKMYDKSIKAYNTYLLLNENDEEIKEELDEVYEEMLGIE